MSLKPIKHANKGNIVFLSNSNYDQLFSSIQFALGKNALFAPLTISGSSLLWTPVYDGLYRSITDAPEEIKGTLVVLWEQTKKDLLPKLSVQDLDFVLEVPDLSYIFYVEDTSNNDGVLNHRFQLLITGWACQNGAIKNDEGDYGMTTRIHEAKNRLQNVKACMVDETGQPIANDVFIYTFENSVIKEEKTDSFGEINTGLCVVGSKLTYTYKLTGQTKMVVVQKNIDTYTIMFAPTTEISIKVLDQFNRPLQAHDVKVEYGVNTYNLKTDGLGEICIENVLYSDSSLQVAVTVDGFDPELFSVTYPKCDIIIRVQIEDTIKPYLKILRDGNPVAGFSVFVAGRKTGTFSSNNEGIISLDGMLVGDVFNVKSISDSETISEKYEIEEGKSEYVFEIPHEEKPVYNDCYIKVLKKSDNQPVPDYSLRFESMAMNGFRLTDSNGIIPLENVTIGSVVNVFKNNTSEPEQIQIEQNKIEYILFVDDEIKIETQNCHIKIEDESGQGVAGLFVKIESSLTNDYFTSDEKGMVFIGDLEVGEEIKCNVPAENQIYSFFVEKGKEEYVIKINQRPFIKTLDCHLKVVEGPEQVPVDSFSIRLESDTMQGFFLTDSFGVLPLENMTPGMEVSCFVEKGRDPIVFKIEEGKEEYLIQIDKRPDITFGDILVSLVDRDKETPVSPATITLTNKQGEKFTQQNDYRGGIVVPRSFFKDQEIVLFHAENESKHIRDCKFRYSNDCDNYVVYLKGRHSWKWLIWFLLLPFLLLLSLIRCERDITVHTIDNRKQNVSNVFVQLKYKEYALYKNNQLFYHCLQQIPGETDSLGYYTFKGTPCSLYSYLFHSLKKAVATGSKNAISGGESSFIYHWQNEVDIVISGSKQIQVRSRKTNQPIFQARVDININSTDYVDSTLITDINGLCRFNMNKDLFISHLAQMTVTKTGYSGVRLKNVEIDNNDTLPLVVYLDEPEPCQDRESNNRNGNQGKLAIRDYDMSSVGGEFIFNYYTDSAPDEILVYDGSSSDYVNGDAPLIFHYEGATNTTTYKHLAKIKFSSRYICVIVKGGTNWGYIVRCPD